MQDRLRHGQYSTIALVDDGALLSSVPTPPGDGDGSGVDVRNVQTVTFGLKFKQNLTECYLQIYLQAPSGRWYIPDGAPLHITSSLHTDTLVLDGAYERIYLSAYRSGAAELGGVEIELIMVMS